jgi:hypothetical protein
VENQHFLLLAGALLNALLLSLAQSSSSLVGVADQSRIDPNLVTTVECILACITLGAMTAKIFRSELAGAIPLATTAPGLAGHWIAQMSDQPSATPRKWRPGQAIGDSQASADPEPKRFAPRQRKGHVITGEVSNFDARSSEYSKSTSWMDWNFNIQCYNTDGAKTDIIPVLMTFVSKGRLIDGNAVEVRGSFDSSGEFRADRINNLSTGAIIRPAMSRDVGDAAHLLRILYTIGFLILFVCVAAFIFRQFKVIHAATITPWSTTNPPFSSGFPPPQTNQIPPANPATSDSTVGVNPAPADPAYTQAMAQVQAAYQAALTACKSSPNSDQSNIDQCDYQAQQQYNNTMENLSAKHNKPTVYLPVFHGPITKH